MVPTEDALWVLTFDGTLSRIDLATRVVTEPIDGVFMAGGSYAESVDPLIVDGSLWAQRRSSLVEIDLAGQEITNEYRWPWARGADWMAEIDGDIWAWRKWTSRSGGERETLARFDLGTREFTFELDMDNKDYRGHPEASGDAIWSKNQGSNDVERFDVASLAVSDTVELGRWTGGAGEDLLDGVIATEGSMWIRQGGYVYRFDTDTREVGDVIRVGDGRGQSTYADGAMWAVSGNEGKVYRIDTDASEVTHTIEVGGTPGTPLAFAGAIWVPDEENGTVTRIATGAATE